MVLKRATGNCFVEKLGWSGKYVKHAKHVKLIKLVKHQKHHGLGNKPAIMTWLALFAGAKAELGSDKFASQLTMGVKRKLQIYAHGQRILCLPSFYRTRVRSLAMLVSN